MRIWPSLLIMVGVNLVGVCATAFAAVQTLDLSKPRPFAHLDPFVLGTAVNPNGETITANGISLLYDGKPVIPVMGEFHFTRVPRAEWRDELLKMKAGGITIVSSYVFWIHHEETEGIFNWADNHDLHAFVELCGQLGLKCVIRCGPWDHGEVRNGGFPEWLIDKHLKLRSNDPAYLAEVQKLYTAIAQQLKGTLWKEGGPVIGIQIENEYGGPAEHLLTLRKMAIDAGLDVPIYTRTGWPELKGTIEFGKLLPLYGGYAEGFWDRRLTTMPSQYWKEFAFKTVRSDTAIASEHFGDRNAKDASDVENYPYLTCELGAGMMCSYHRRITVFPMDPLSMLIVKLGSGSNLPGYYMYHGGTNPEGVEPELQEHQATRFTNYNDLPVKTYDFQTAVGEFGQIRPQYHLLRLVHLFLHDFGSRLALMPTVLPEFNLTKNDSATLRYGVRTDGQSGFVFINNYQRLQSMPAKPGTQFSFKLKSETMTFPSTPTTVAADHAFFWPFNFDLGDGINLAYATAQPVCEIADGQTQYTIFAKTGNAAEFAFDVHGAKITSTGLITIGGDRTIVKDPQPGLSPVVTITTAEGIRHCILLFSETDALRLWKGPLGGQDQVALSTSCITFDDHLRAEYASNAVDPNVLILGSATTIQPGRDDGVFHRLTMSFSRLSARPFKIVVQQLKPAGALRTILMGAAKVAAGPTEHDFDQAAVWHIQLPADTDPTRHLMLRIHYTGDVARAYCGEKLIDDNFYNGTPFDVGVNRFGENLAKYGITLKILPLQKQAPIYMLDNVRPDFGDQPSVVGVQSVDVIESLESNYFLDHVNIKKDRI